jgi:hypothetical protein
MMSASIWRASGLGRDIAVDGLALGICCCQRSGEIRPGILEHEQDGVFGPSICAGDLGKGRSGTGPTPIPPGHFVPNSKWPMDRANYCGRLLHLPLA